MWPMSDDYRVERDTMGEVRVPTHALYQAQTQRAVENFPISSRPIDPDLIAALGLIKGAAAQANAKLGVLDSERAEAIAAAVAKKALKEGKTIRQVVIESGFVENGMLTLEQLDATLDVLAMTRRPE
jgi:fumarate hydratase class II